MIVNCPKCGFTQPKDRYCAKCGVDMEAFRPKKAPLSSRILKSWIFQSAVLIVAIVTALSFLRLQREREVEQQVVDYTKPPPLPGGQAALEAPAPPRPAQTQVAARTPIPQPAAVAANARAASASRIATQGINAGTVHAAGASPRTGEAARDSAFTQVDIVYAEIPRNVLSNLQAGSRML